MKPLPYLAELSSLAVALSLLASTANASLYTKNSPVLQLDGASYKSLIEKSNYSSIVEFYAPWCGHCKNLAPAYQKAATSLSGLANVAAVNCDEEANKPFCGRMGVQGFPTLKLVKPGGVRKNGKKASPSVTDYQGPREAKAIIEAVKDKMPNHVTRVKDDNLDTWLDSDNPKGLIFGDKGLVPPLAKALAIDFLGSLDVGYSRAGDKKTMQKYGIKEFPTVVLIPGKNKDPIKFDGEVNKASLLDFFKQAATPNPDAVKSTAKAKASSTKKPKTSSSKGKSASSDAKSEEAGSCPYAKSGAKNPHTAETVVDDGPLESPGPDVSGDKPKPVKVPAEPAPKLTALDSVSALQKACLNKKSGTCVLAIVPAATAEQIEDAAQSVPALTSLSNIAHKHAASGRKMFPVYSVPETGVADALLKGLGLKSGQNQPIVVAVNAKKSWWTQYRETEFEGAKLEGWFDNIRFGDFKKEKLADSLVVEAEAEAAKEEAAESETTSTKRDEL